jgi:hypothetical protein
VTAKAGELTAVRRRNGFRFEANGRIEPEARVEERELMEEPVNEP